MAHGFLERHAGAQVTVTYLRHAGGRAAQVGTITLLSNVTTWRGGAGGSSTCDPV